MSVLAARGRTSVTPLLLTNEARFKHHLVARFQNMPEKLSVWHEILEAWQKIATEEMPTYKEHGEDKY